MIVSISLGLVCKLPLLAQTWRQVQLLRIAPLALAAVVGTYFGTQLLLRVDADVLRLVLGIVVVLLASPMLFEFRPAGRSARGSPRSESGSSAASSAARRAWAGRRSSSSA